MYVRRWPRISASSRMPPSEMRWNFRPSARAIDRPSDVLPTPGGPTKQRIGSLPSGRIFFTARYSRIRSLILSSPSWSSSRIAPRRDRDRRRRWSPASTASRPASRCRCGPPCTRRRPAASCASRSSSRSASLLGLLGHPGRLDLLAERVDLLRALVGLAQLLLDRLQLLAQVVLALGLGDLRLHLGLDLDAQLERPRPPWPARRPASAAARGRRTSPAAPASARCRAWAATPR